MVEDLYREAVGSPEDWTSERAAEWIQDAFPEGPPDREAARHLRRAMRTSIKLAEFWRDPDRTAPADPLDWRARIDIALGARAWRPLLDLARVGLERAPTEELFETVKELFPLVENDRWMDGVSYETWRDGLDAPG